MFKSRGIRLPVTYFYECHLFDLLNGTNTHEMVGKGDYIESPVNFDHGNVYMCSWTSELRKSINTIVNLLEGKFCDYFFADVGCGKGKAILVWKKMFPYKAAIGVDYSANLLDIAERNCQKMGFDDCIFRCGDAATFDWSAFGNKFIFYLYNPFDEVILKSFLKRISSHDTVLIYVNPVSADVIAMSGYKLVHEQIGWHPNACAKIFVRAAT